MEDPKADTGELVHGLRPNSRKEASKPTPVITNAKERSKKISAPDRVDEKATYASERSNQKLCRKLMAALEASLLTELHESRSREEELRNKLAKSRVATKHLQAKLAKYDQAQRQVHVIENPTKAMANCKTEQPVPKPAPIASRASWCPPVLSCCGDLRQLARNQVIRSVQDLTPEFTVDLQVHSYGGYIPWPKVLAWLEDHPETVYIIGLNLHALRTI